MKHVWVTIYILLLPAATMAHEFSWTNHEFSLDNIIDKYYFTPGTITSIPITITNNATAEEQYTVTVESSSSKIDIFQAKREISTKAFQKSIVLLPIKIATDCASGESEITLTVRHKETSTEKTYTIKIIIALNNSLIIKSLKTNEYTKAGDTIISNFMIKNAGNITQEITVRSDNGKIANGVNPVVLMPGEEKIIVVKTATNKKEITLVQKIIDLQAQRSQDKESVISAYSYSNIIPVHAPTLDAYMRLPIHASLSYVTLRHANTTEQGWQGELSASGKINTNPDYSFFLRMVTKSPIKQNTYGPNEEYYARITNKKLMLHIGDNSYSSSVLTEYFRYGRGAELKYTTDKFELGTFYNKPRFFKDIKDEFHLGGKWNINTTTSIAAGYLQKRPSDDSINHKRKLINPVHLPYILLKSNTLKNTNIETEYAYSKTGNLTGSAIRIQATNSFNAFSSNFSFLYASPNYRGYTHNTTNFNGAINYKVSSKFSAFINHFQDARNLQRDTLFLEAPYLRFTQLGGAYYYSNKGNINVLSGQMRNEDRLATNLFNYQESFVKVNINQAFGRFQIDLASHFGYTNNFITHTKGDSKVHQLSIAYNRYTTQIRAYGSIANTSRYDDANSIKVYYGAQLNQQIANKTAVNLRYQNNYTPEEYFQDRNQFEGVIIQKIGSHQIFELNSRLMLQRGQLGSRDFIASLKYIAKINLPIKRIADYATLSGTIHGENKEALQGIKVMLGSQIAITNKDGIYTFKNIIPGEYYLDIDRQTLSIDAISDIVLPTAVSIQKNIINQQNIEITKAAMIKGKVKIANKNNSNIFLLDKGKIDQSSVIVEASNGVQIFRKICSIGDAFDFTYLRPGLWSIKVYGNSLNNNLKINTDTFDLDLQPNEVKEVCIDISIIQKEIRYQQEPMKIGHISTK